MFSFFETSRHSGEPILLYRAVYGTGASDYIALTDAEEDITIEGVTYKGKQAIKCPPITASGTLDKSTLELQVALDNPLTELFRSDPPDSVVTLKIMRAHYGDVVNGALAPANVITIWGGRILNFEVDEDYQVTLSCDPIGSNLRHAGLRRPYSIGCPHLLYGSACGAPAAAFTVEADVVAVDGNKITLADGWNGSLPAAKFPRGVLMAAGSSSTATRTILTVDGNTLTVAGATTLVQPGGKVSLRLGCGHTMDDCKNVFNNILNYGGHPWIPTEAPTRAKSFFY